MQEDTRDAEKVFAGRLRERREAKGMTQSQIALKVEMWGGIRLDPTAVTRMETGQRSIRLGEAVAIAGALDTTVDEMLRPALPPEEQLAQAEKQADAAWWRAAGELAELEAARRRLNVLREQLGLGRDGDGERSADGRAIGLREGGDDGEHPEAP